MKWSLFLFEMSVCLSVCPAKKIKIWITSPRIVEKIISDEISCWTKYQLSRIVGQVELLAESNCRQSRIVGWVELSAESNCQPSRNVGQFQSKYILSWNAQFQAHNRLQACSLVFNYFLFRSSKSSSPRMDFDGENDQGDYGVTMTIKINWQKIFAWSCWRRHSGFTCRARGAKTSRSRMTPHAYRH